MYLLKPLYTKVYPGVEVPSTTFFCTLMTLKFSRYIKLEAEIRMTD